MVKIIKAAPRHLASICRLSRQVHTLHYKKDPSFFRPFSGRAFRAYFRALLADKKHFVWVAEEGGALAAFAVFEVQDEPRNALLKRRHFLYLDQICTDKSVRRRGVGKKIVAYAVKEARSRGFSKLVLDVWHFNGSAQAFFKSLGFRCQIHRMSRSM
jgi:diamine N-acetyltransferase